MPQTVFDVGDPITSRLKLGVTPDVSTAVTVAVYRPDGTAIAAPAISAWENTDEKTAQWYATDDGAAGSATGSATGDWVAVWRITGTGANTAAKVYNVRPLPVASNTRPAWVPFLSDVGDYVPRLTVDTVTPGSAIEYGTFNGLTTPTDEQAMRLLDRAVGSVTAAAGTIATSVYGQAATVATLRAAASIQRAYARSAEDRAAADALDRRADADLARLIAANAAAGAASATSLLPQWAFPSAVAWGDSNL